MNKMEFASAVERHHRKNLRSKWQYLGLGWLFLLILFIPQIREYIVPEVFGLTTTTFVFIAGLCFGRFLAIQWGSKEDELLVAAMEVIKDEVAQNKQL